jgi:hypothetical protein
MRIFGGLLPAFENCLNVYATGCSRSARWSSLVALERERIAGFRNRADRPFGRLVFALPSAFLTISLGARTQAPQPWSKYAKRLCRLSAFEQVGASFSDRGVDRHLGGRLHNRRRLRNRHPRGAAAREVWPR